jgi:hypothetical protein
MNDYAMLKIGQQRAADLRKEAEDYRLANSIRPVRPSWAAARVLASIWVVALGVMLLVGR